MGFKDWEHTETGAPMLKAQHPEFETIYGGAQSSMAKQGYTCADCHMAPAKAEDGTEYSSHNLVNPTEDPAIMEKCEGCHADLPGQIVQWQKETTDREHELAAKLDAYIKTLAEQKDSLDEATLEQARQIHRHAQFYCSTTATHSRRATTRWWRTPRAPTTRVWPRRTSTSARTS